jgi:hypothetical protein
MLHLISALLAAIRVFFRSRADTALEVLALRQQVSVLKLPYRARKIEAYGLAERLFGTSRTGFNPKK